MAVWSTFAVTILWAWVMLTARRSRETRPPENDDGCREELHDVARCRLGRGQCAALLPDVGSAHGATVADGAPAHLTPAGPLIHHRRRVAVLRHRRREFRFSVRSDGVGETSRCRPRSFVDGFDQQRGLGPTRSSHSFGTRCPWCQKWRAIAAIPAHAEPAGTIGARNSTPNRSAMTVRTLPRRARCRPGRARRKALLAYRLGRCPGCQSRRKVARGWMHVDRDGFLTDHSPPALDEATARGGGCPGFRGT
jgi:hypothetical protein